MSGGPCKLVYIPSCKAQDRGRARFSGNSSTVRNFNTPGGARVAQVAHQPSAGADAQTRPPSAHARALMDKRPHHICHCMCACECICTHVHHHANLLHHRAAIEAQEVYTARRYCTLEGQCHAQASACMRSLSPASLGCQLFCPSCSYRPAGHQCVCQARLQCAVASGGGERKGGQKQDLHDGARYPGAHAQ